MGLPRGYHGKAARTASAQEDHGSRAVNRDAMGNTLGRRLVCATVISWPSALQSGLMAVVLAAPVAFAADCREAALDERAEVRHAVQWRGVHFNPQVASDPNFPWLLHYADHRARVRAALLDLRRTARMNLVAVFVMLPHSLCVPGMGNRVGQAIGDWANTRYLDNVALFVDDCHAAGLCAELDLVDNRWVPHSVDAPAHIGKPGNPWWPVADDDPWD